MSARAAGVDFAFESFQYRDASGQPVDVDFVFAIAGRHRDAPAVAPAIGKEPDRAETFVDDVLLRGEQLQLHVARERVLLGVLVDLEALAGEIEPQEGFAAVRKRFAARRAQSGRELARGCTQAAR